ncbi:MAG: helix-turn-helix domain-containing protein, partial [Thiolinea sp.]
RHPKSGQACVIGAYLKILLVLLSRSATPVSSQDRNYDARFSVYEQFMKALELRFREHWPVRQYAERLGLTESRLNRLCQKFAGQNALQIIHGRVITEAKRKLIYADLSVNEVAYELGFKDPAYFSRFFTKHCEEAPGQFKKRLREKGGT